MLTRLTEDMKDAMRAKDKLRLNTVRAIIAELKNMGIEKKGAKGLTEEVSSPAEYLDDQETLSCLRTMVKKRKEAAEQYTEGGRLELAEKELAEVSILADYLPQPLSAEEMENLVQEAIAEVGAQSMKEMGLVMKAVQPKVAGRADGKALSDCVRSLLG